MKRTLIYKERGIKEETPMPGGITGSREGLYDV
jgi:hypothetical protein